MVHYPGNVETGSPAPRKMKKRLIFSQSMVVDIDPNKVRVRFTGPVPLLILLGTYSEVTKLNPSSYTMILSIIPQPASTSNCNG